MNNTYSVCRKLKEDCYEAFGKYETREEAEKMEKIIKAFLGYETIIVED